MEKKKEYIVPEIAKINIEADGILTASDDCYWGEEHSGTHAYYHCIEEAGDAGAGWIGNQG